MTLVETIKKDAKTSKWVGILMLIAGFLALVAPLGTGISITLMIGALLLVSGIAQLLFGGITTLVLGVMIRRQFPLSGVWAVGTLVGIQLLFSGWLLIAIGGAAREAVTA